MNNYEDMCILSTHEATSLPKIHYGALSGVPLTKREVNINRKFPCNRIQQLLYTVHN